MRIAFFLRMDGFLVIGLLMMKGGNLELRITNYEVGSGKGEDGRWTLRLSLRVKVGRWKKACLVSSVWGCPRLNKYINAKGKQFTNSPSSF